MKARVPVAIFEGHVVQRGETLSGIAARYSVSLDGILALNPRLNPRALRPGTELVIPRVNARASAKAAAPATATARPVPAATPAAVPTATPAVAPTATPDAAPAVTPAATPAPAATASARLPDGVWHVKQGDTLWSISRNTGLPLEELCRLNGIGNPRHHRLQVGATLRVASSRG
jgi:membrane-bound lytic murein transglycosylase D